MKDTPPAIERKFRQMLLERSGAERLKMGCSMHATARALAVASLSQKHPNASPAELRRLLFLHFYRADFSPTQRNRIASALSKNARRSEATETRVRRVFETAESQTRVHIAERPAAYRTRRRSHKKEMSERHDILPTVKRFERSAAVERLERFERVFRR